MGEAESNASLRALPLLLVIVCESLHNCACEHKTGVNHKPLELAASSHNISDLAGPLLETGNERVNHAAGGRSQCCGQLDSSDKSKRAREGGVGVVSGASGMLDGNGIGPDERTIGFVSRGQRRHQEQHRRRRRHQQQRRLRAQQVFLGREHSRRRPRNHYRPRANNRAPRSTHWGAPLPVTFNEPAVATSDFGTLNEAFSDELPAYYIYTSDADAAAAAAASDAHHEPAMVATTTASPGRQLATKPAIGSTTAGAATMSTSRPTWMMAQTSPEFPDVSTSLSRQNESAAVSSTTTTTPTTTTTTTTTMATMMTTSMTASDRGGRRPEGPPVSDKLAASVAPDEHPPSRPKPAHTPEATTGYCVGVKEGPSTIAWQCSSHKLKSVPVDLYPTPTSLRFSNVIFDRLPRDSLQPYRETLRDFSIEHAPRLRTIEPGAFGNLTRLRVVYIFQAPRLTSFDLAIVGRHPDLATIRIQQTGLRSWPDLSELRQERILTSIDLDNNKIETLGSKPINIRAELLNLEFNLIGFIGEHTFNGSEIAVLSLSGNRQLTSIHMNAFANLKNLDKLDLSSTSVAQLPSVGLHQLRTLTIRDNYALRQIPSIYAFPSLVEAHLTYSYHCCSFRYPETHDPSAYEEHIKLQNEINAVCAKRQTQGGGGTIVATSVSQTIGPLSGHEHDVEENAHARARAESGSTNFPERASSDDHEPRSQTQVPLVPSAGPSAPGAQWSQQTAGSSAGSTGSPSSDFEGSFFDMSQLPARALVDLGHHQLDGSREPTRSAASSATAEPAAREPGVAVTKAAAAAAAAAVQLSASGLVSVNEQAPGQTLGQGQGQGQGQVASSALGSLNRPWLLQNIECGELVLKSSAQQNITCEPEPDAFNPCEDIMGFPVLRVAVWFVVACSVLGNLSVIIVLLGIYRRLSVPKFLQLNLAIGDLFMGVYLAMLAAADLTTVGSYFNYAIDWQHGLGCRLAGASSLFASQLSIFTLSVITFERYYTITYSIDLNMRLQLGWAARIMLLGWLFAFSSAMLPIWADINSYSKTSICLPMRTARTLDRAFIIVLLLIDSSAFLIIFICYLKMYLLILKQKTEATLKERTVAMRMALLVLTDFACWAPIIFFGATAILGRPLISVTKSKILVVFFYPLNSMANPFLYVLSTRQYRRDLHYVIGRWHHWRKNLFKRQEDKDYSFNNQQHAYGVIAKYPPALNAHLGAVAAMTGVANHLHHYKLNYLKQVDPDGCEADCGGAAGGPALLVSGGQSEDSTGLGRAPAIHMDEGQADSLTGFERLKRIATHRRPGHLCGGHALSEQRAGTRHRCKRQLCAINRHTGADGARLLASPLMERAGTPPGHYIIRHQIIPGKLTRASRGPSSSRPPRQVASGLLAKEKRSFALCNAISEQPQATPAALVADTPVGATKPANYCARPSAAGRGSQSADEPPKERLRGGASKIVQFDRLDPGERAGHRRRHQRHRHEGRCLCVGVSQGRRSPEEGQSSELALVVVSSASGPATLSNSNSNSNSNSTKTNTNDNTNTSTSTSVGHESSSLCQLKEAHLDETRGRTPTGARSHPHPRHEHRHRGAHHHKHHHLQRYQHHHHHHHHHRHHKRQRRHSDESNQRNHQHHHLSHHPHAHQKQQQKQQQQQQQHRHRHRHHHDAVVVGKGCVHRSHPRPAHTGSQLDKPLSHYRDSRDNLPVTTSGDAHPSKIKLQTETNLNNSERHQPITKITQICAESTNSTEPTATTISSASTSASGEQTKRDTAVLAGALSGTPQSAKSVAGREPRLVCGVCAPKETRPERQLHGCGSNKHLLVSAGAATRTRCTFSSCRCSWCSNGDELRCEARGSAGEHRRDKRPKCARCRRHLERKSGDSKVPIVDCARKEAVGADHLGQSVTCNGALVDALAPSQPIGGRLCVLNEAAESESNLCNGIEV